MPSLSALPLRKYELIFVRFKFLARRTFPEGDSMMILLELSSC